MTPIPLASTERSTRILITLFLVVMLAAIVVAGLNIYDKVGRLPGGAVQRYGPDGTASADINALPKEGDTLTARMNTFSQLLDITHAHVFELPLVMFVLAHFLMRSRVPEPLKLGNYLASTIGTVIFLAAPWLVRYVSVRLAGLLYIGAASVGVSALLMIVIPIYDMWRDNFQGERLEVGPY